MAATTTVQAGGGATITVAGEWLQFTVSPPVYASRFLVSAYNPAYLPDAYQLLGSTDGAGLFKSLIEGLN